MNSRKSFSVEPASEAAEARRAQKVAEAFAEEWSRAKDHQLESMSEGEWQEEMDRRNEAADQAEDQAQALENAGW